MSIAPPLHETLFRQRNPPAGVHSITLHSRTGMLDTKGVLMDDAGC